MALNESITQMTDVIAQDLSEGRASRQTIGGQSEAFGWTGGLPITLANFIATAQVAGMSAPITRVTPSGTPVEKVGEGSLKPTAVDIATEDVPLAKYAGTAVASLESVISAAGLIPAVVSVLGAGALMAYEADAVAQLATDAGDTVTGADWTEALTNGQAAVLGNGGVPGVIVVSAVDYAAVVAGIVGGAGFAQDPNSAIGSFLGSLIHASPSAPTGTAYVIDPSGVLALEQTLSPIVTVDPFSLSQNNQTRITGDLIAATVVTNPAHVVEVTVTPV